MGCKPSCCSSNKEKNCISIVFNLKSQNLPESVLQGFAQVLGSLNNYEEIAHDLKPFESKVIPSHSTHDPRPETPNLDDRKLIKKSLSHKTFEENLSENRKNKEKIRRKSQRPACSRDEEYKMANII
jgi:hypothetical protein